MPAGAWAGSGWPRWRGDSLSTATYVGALVLAAAAPLYIPAWRQSQKKEPARV